MQPGDDSKISVLKADAQKAIQDGELGKAGDLLAEIEKIQNTKGRQPQRITSGDPPFFDPRSGKPSVWYSKDKDGTIEIFDLMGFHPETGDTLQSVTPEIVELWKAQKAAPHQRPPERIGDPERSAFFDPVTGKPRVWYWRGTNGEYEFYDNPGYHPRTGEPLSVITREAFDAWKRDTEAAANKKRDDQIALEQQAAQAEHDRQVAEEQKRLQEAQIAAANKKRDDQIALQQQAAQAEHDRQVAEEQKRLQEAQIAAANKKRDDQIALQQQAAQAEHERQIAEEQKRQREEEEDLAAAQKQAQLCDQLAVNPTDQRKPANVPGVLYSVLESKAKDAVDACMLAMKTYPEEQRYRYQYARALEVDDPVQALGLHKELVLNNYPATFDNVGALLIKTSQDYTQAIKYFNEGALRGDPDCMVSLADMIDRQYVYPTDPAAKCKLLSWAAQHGHSGAQRAVDRERVKCQQLQQQREFPQQLPQLMFQIFGSVLQRLPH